MAKGMAGSAFGADSGGAAVFCARPGAEACAAAASMPASRHPFLDRYDAKNRRGRLYSTGEEIGNAVSHGVGFGLAVAALVLLCVGAARGGGGLKTCAAVMMGVTLVCEYLFSTLYHAIQAPRGKAVLRILDHSAIYLLIAGCYAPFTLVTLHDAGGVPLCVAVWTIALVGILLECFGRQRQPKWVSALIYLAMGWAIAFKLPALLSLLAPGGVALLVAGGLAYSAGCVFYVLKRIPYSHMVFHFFVLGGSVCHTLAVLLFVF